MNEFKHHWGWWLMLIGCLLFLHTARADWKDWDRTEKNLFIAYNVGSWIDYEQSKDAFKTKEFEEINPFFPNVPHPDRLLLQKALGSYLIYYVNDNTKHRKTGLIAANVVQWGIVIHHESIGINFNISW